jgi:hypothetical protein
MEKLLLRLNVAFAGQGENGPLAFQIEQNRRYLRGIVRQRVVEFVYAGGIFPVQ